MTARNDSSHNKVTFAAIADPHVGTPGNEFSEAICLCNRLDVDFVILLGDLVTKPTEDTIAQLIRDLKALEKPLYIAMGNHDAHPGAREEGIYIEDRLRQAFPGPWQESFSYAFDCGSWRFIVVGGIDHMKTDLENFYVNNCKGFVNRGSYIMYLLEDDRRRLIGLLEQSGDQPTCVTIHVPVVPIAARLHEQGIVDQTRLIENIQLSSVIEARSNVKLILSGHQHFNQVDVVGDQLHCVTQQLQGAAARREGPGIRVIELTDRSISGRLVWDGSDDEPFGTIGTLSGDRAFQWTFA